MLRCGDATMETLEDGMLEIEMQINGDDMKDHYMRMRPPEVQASSAQDCHPRGWVPYSHE